VAGIAGGIIGGDSAKKAAAEREKKAMGHLADAKGEFQQVSPEMLALYRGLMPELQANWKDARGQLSNLSLAARQRIGDEGDRTFADIQQGLTKAKLWSTGQQANLKRAQQADEARKQLEVDSMMAGSWLALKGAQAASMAGGRVSAAQGLGGIAAQLGSYDEKMAGYYMNPQNEAPHMSVDGKGIGALAGSMWNAIGGTDWGSLFSNVGSDQSMMNQTGMSGSTV